MNPLRNLWQDASFYSTSTKIATEENYHDQNLKREVKLDICSFINLTNSDTINILRITTCFFLKKMENMDIKTIF